MSVFRPSARVVGPDGRLWEIYAYKVKLRDRNAPRVRARRRPVRRFVAHVAAVARSLRADEWTIEAVTFAAHAERHAWTTTTEYKGQVLAQVEGNLARGDVPKNLSHATPTI